MIPERPEDEAEVDDQEQEAADDQGEGASVEEQSEQSFPASDPPSY